MYTGWSKYPNEGLVFPRDDDSRKDLCIADEAHEILKVVVATFAGVSSIRARIQQGSYRNVRDEGVFQMRHGIMVACLLQIFHHVIRH